jgi:hypothetical protein
MPTIPPPRPPGFERFPRSTAFAATLLALPTLLLSSPAHAAAQGFDEDQTGAWYMLFWNTTFGEGPWGLQGDTQYRDWSLLGDMEQLLLRAGLTYTPEDRPVTFTLGVAHITTGAFGESDATFSERRIYQEALLPQRVGEVRLRHRYRSEQRWVDDQDFRTRYRYALFADVPLNGRGTGPGALYLALYDEVFINGETSIGEGRQVQRFDRNRLYAGLGYGITTRLRLQGGYMWQTVVAGTKGQLQFSALATF